MKTYTHLYDSFNNLDGWIDDIESSSKKKTERHDVQNVLRNKEAYAARLVDMFTPDAEGNIKYTFATGSPTVTINADSNRKTRTIQKPRYVYEQIIHHGIVRALRPVIEHSFYEYTCGSIPGRGPHYGKNYINRIMTRDRKNTKYVFKYDIRHFYETVDHEILLQALFKLVKDVQFQKILRDLVTSYSPGLPLGWYTSQWFGNYLLTELDHYIVNRPNDEDYTRWQNGVDTPPLKSIGADYFRKTGKRIGKTYYVRYMDDMVVFSRSKKELHIIKDLIAEHLASKGLTIKGDYQIFPLDKRPLDYMGFKFHRDNTIIRKTIMVRMTRLAGRIGGLYEISHRDAAAMLSYLGWVRSTDSYSMYLQRIKPCIRVRQLKHIVSKHSRKELKRHGHGMVQNREHSRAAGI